MKPANGSQSDEIGAACVRGRRPHSLLLREMAERRSTDVPDYGVSGTTRRYTLIVGMLVALATVPTLVVMAVGAASVDSPASGGTPIIAAPPRDPVVVVTDDPTRPAPGPRTVQPPLGAPTTSAPPPVPPSAPPRRPAHRPTPRGTATATSAPSAGPTASPAPGNAPRRPPPPTPGPH